MDGFISSLLQYSRTNSADLKLTHTNLKKIVNKKLDMIEEFIKDNNAIITIKNQLPSLVCDANYIGEVFQNLIVNGIKYNKNTQKLITIDYQELPDYYQFTISDNGIGIDPKNTDNVYKIFKRLHARDEFGGGTGAGMTIARKIIERHGGKIWFESKLNQGTAFYFTINKHINPRPIGT